MLCMLSRERFVWTSNRYTSRYGFTKCCIVMLVLFVVAITD